mgnify:CR=1 FL=1
MASRRKLDVEEAPSGEEAQSKIKFEEACILVTFVALIAGVVMILLKMGSTYNAGPFA